VGVLPLFTSTARSPCTFDEMQGFRLFSVRWSPCRHLTPGECNGKPPLFTLISIALEDQSAPKITLLVLMCPRDKSRRCAPVPLRGRRACAAARGFGIYLKTRQRRCLVYT
jgi:hypothetical protein